MTDHEPPEPAERPRKVRLIDHILAEQQRRRDPVAHRTLSFTEDDPQMSALWEAVQSRQLDDKSLRNLTDAELVWLAGHVVRHQAWTDDQWVKIRQNAERASMERDRRSTVDTRWMQAAMVLVGAVAGATGSLIVQAIVK